MENKVFETLNSINVNNMVEKKATGGSTLTYLSWASAWKIAKSHYPDLEYEVERNPQTNLPYWYDPQTGYMVFTKITIQGQTHEMWLPVMDGTNHAMKAEPYEVQTKYKKFTVPAATMADVNKAIMRCLTKNLAMFGLALYVYCGEDYPSDTAGVVTQQPAQQPIANKPVMKAAPTAPQAQAPAKDTRPAANDPILNIVRDALKEKNIPEAFVSKAYKVEDLSKMMMYQAQHVIRNIDKLAAMYAKENPVQAPTPAPVEEPVTEVKAPEGFDFFSASNSELAGLAAMFG